MTKTVISVILMDIFWGRWRGRNGRSENEGGAEVEGGFDRSPDLNNLKCSGIFTPSLRIKRTCLVKSIIPLTSYTMNSSLQLLILV